LKAHSSVPPYCRAGTDMGTLAQSEKHDFRLSLVLMTINVELRARNL